MKVGFIFEGKIIKKIQFQKGSSVILTIGRTEGNDIVLPLPQISKNHAQLIFDEAGDLFLIDTESRNGSFVNGKKLTPNSPCKISVNDKIELASDNKFEVLVTLENLVQSEVKLKPSTNIDTQATSSSISEIFKLKNKITIGRNEDCDVVIPSGSVSRNHATLEKLNDQSFKVTDLNSTNGTYVNGSRISGTKLIGPKDKLLIGKFILGIEGGVKDLSREAAIKAERIVNKYSNGYVGLHETSIEIPAKSLLAVMGPSGCGKSTLLKALNGDSPPSSGRVTICGLELNENYDYIKTHIGYVPQDDIVHRELSVYKTLYYAAKLRLINASDEAIEDKIKDVLDALNISHIKNNLVSGISGGQRKRVSIAVEILTDPLILFLDEPTSPLDPQTIEEFLTCSRKLAERGTTIIMVTHKPEDLVYMDSVIFMAEGGHLVYYGDTKTYLDHFKQNRLTQVYAELVKENAGPWIETYKTNNPIDQSKNLPPQEIKKTDNINYFKQFRWLTTRYFNIKLNDRLNSMLMMGQAAIIALLVIMIFSKIELSVLFLCAISAIWFGANNAAREIVGEASVYKRERMYNQSIFVYIMSKITVLGTFALIQCIIFIGILTVFYGGNEHVVLQDPILCILWMFMLSITATLMGLLLSALVNSTEKVMTLIPISLLPQILLAGVLSKISSPFGEYLSYIIIARWGTEGLTNIQKDVEIVKQVPDPTTQEMKVSTLPDGSEEYLQLNATDALNKNFHSTYQDVFSDLSGTLTLDFVALGSLALIFFIGIYIALKRKDSIRIG